MNRYKLLGNQKGAAAVEFAVILLPLLLTLFGVIEFGLAMFNKQVITNAAREGARAGVVVRVPRLNNEEIESVVKDWCAYHLITFGNSGPDVENPWVGIPEIGSDPVKIANGEQRCALFQCDLPVIVTYDYEFLFLKNFGVGPWEIRSVATMKME